jgi:hypothetical protein
VNTSAPVVAVLPQRQTPKEENHAEIAGLCAMRRVDDAQVIIDDDKLLGIKIELTVEPFLAPLQDVGAILLCRMRSLFARYLASREEPPYRAERPLRS